MAFVSQHSHQGGSEISKLFLDLPSVPGTFTPELTAGSGLEIFALGMAQTSEEIG
jgi:hypothetical protein